jgi:hypothetical protein
VCEQVAKENVGPKREEKSESKFESLIGEGGVLEECCMRGRERKRRLFVEGPYEMRPLDISTHARDYNIKKHLKEF